MKETGLIFRYKQIIHKKFRQKQSFLKKKRDGKHIVFFRISCIINMLFVSEHQISFF